jgi:GT2 family glycosyltransferase
MVKRGSTIMKIGITAPVFIKNTEHKRFLDLTTKSLISVDHDLVWIPVENFVEPGLLPIAYSFDHEPESIHVVKGRQPQGVAKAWNDGIRKALDLGCDYVLVINTDIVLKSNAIDRLVPFALTRTEALIWTMAEYSDLALLEESPEDENFSEHPHFSCFMVKPEAFISEFGLFDESFIPAYLEDGDAHGRMGLANQKAYIYGGARFYHFGSRTIKSDHDEWAKNTVTFPRNQQYFLDKWGHPPVNEVELMRQVYFKHPYNESDKPLNYWRGNEENEATN